MCNNLSLLGVQEKPKLLANWLLSAESFDSTAKVLIFSLNGTIKDGTDVPAHKSFNLYIIFSCSHPAARSQLYPKDSSAKFHLVSKLKNVIFRRNVWLLQGTTVPSFILVSLELGYLDNSQQLVFSRRGFHHDSAQRYCRRRPPGKACEKAHEIKMEMPCNGRGGSEVWHPKRRRGPVTRVWDGPSWKSSYASPVWLMGDPVRNGGSNSRGRCTEGCGWFALRWVSADVSGGDKCIYSLQRLLSAAVLRLSLEKTSIRTPAYAMKSSVCLLGLQYVNPRCPDGPSHTHGMQKRKSWGRCGPGTVQLQGKLGNITYRRGRRMKKGVRKEIKGAERGWEIKRRPRNILFMAMNRELPQPARSSLMWWSRHPDTASVPISNVGMPNCIPPFTSWHVGRKVTSQSHNTNTLSSLLRAV